MVEASLAIFKCRWLYELVRFAFYDWPLVRFHKLSNLAPTGLLEKNKLQLGLNPQVLSHEAIMLTAMPSFGDLVICRGRQNLKSWPKLNEYFFRISYLPKLGLPSLTWLFALTREPSRGGCHQLDKFGIISALFKKKLVVKSTHPQRGKFFINSVIKVLLGLTLSASQILPT